MIPRLILVENAGSGDLESICEIDRVQISGSKRRNYIARAVERGKCFVARMGDQCAGFAIMDQTFYEQGFIWLLVVDPKYRRQGVASELIRHIESISPTAKLFTSTNQSNLIMQRLLTKLGFAKSGNIENLDEGDPEVLYFKRVLLDE